MRVTRLQYRFAAILGLAAGFTTTTPARAQLAQVASASPPATSPAITPADLRVRLFLIADDSMMGREPGGVGDFRTADYVASEFRRLGLEPAGEHGTFFQAVPFYRVGADPATSLSAGSRRIVPGSELILASAPRTQRALAHVATVYAGPLNDSTRWAPAESLAGRVAVFTMAPAADGSRAPFRIGGYLRNPRLAGAALVIVAGLEDVPPEYQAAMAAGRLVTDTITPPGTPGFAVALLKSPVADALFGAPLDRTAPGTSGAPLDGLVGFRLTAVEYPARNVVAVLRGSDPALRHTYVALTAHNDHVGFDHAPVDHDSLRAFNRVMRPMGADSRVMRPPATDEAAHVRTILDSLRALRPARADSIRNGADDDGSGTVSILEIAERMATARRPRRSVLFVSHTGEESGLVGSAWFTDHPTVPRDSIVAEIDQDMVGRGTALDLPAGGPGYLEVVGARRLSREFGDILEAANAAQPQPFTFNYAFDAPGHPLQYYCRADHYNYARYSIPAVAFSRGEHLDYHQVTDEAQYIDYDDMARVSRLVYTAALRIANLDHRPRLDAPRGDPHAVCRQ